MDSGTMGDKAQELRGQAKEAVGQAGDDQDLKVEGAVEENRAEARQAVNGDKDHDVDDDTIENVDG